MKSIDQAVPDEEIKQKKADEKAKHEEKVETIPVLLDLYRGKMSLAGDFKLGYVLLNFETQIDGNRLLPLTTRLLSITNTRSLRSCLKRKLESWHINAPSPVLQPNY